MIIVNYDEVRTLLELKRLCRDFPAEYANIRRNIDDRLDACEQLISESYQPEQQPAPTVARVGLSGASPQLELPLGEPGKVV